MPALPAATRHLLLAGAGAALVSLSAHVILVFPLNLLGLLGGFACYFHALGEGERPRPRLLVGLVFGLLLALGSLYWLADVLHVLTLGERLAGGVILGGFGLLVAVPYGLWPLALGLLERRGLGRAPLVHAAGLLLVQSLVHDVALGFPWLHYGYWLADGPFGPWLGLLGARGSGLLLLYLAACLGRWRRAPRAPEQLLLGAAILGTVLVHPGGSPSGAAARPLRVAVVALDRAVAGDSQHDDLAWLSRYVAATRQSGADWVVWPESVVRDARTSAGPLGVLLGGGPRHVLAGALLPTPAGRHNVVLDLTSGATLYAKQRLVPFSEYLPGEPLRRLFARLGISTLKNDIIAWTAPEPATDLDGVAVVPLLCYEVAFTELVQPGARPALLLALGNESWFRSALLHRMTLAMSVARAREYGLPLVRSVSGGYSGFFDPATERRLLRVRQSGPEVTAVAGVQARPVTTPYGRLRALWEATWSRASAR